MARKKKHEEHENLERWLLSYSDFITLLFATFVVLYALSQVDIAEFAKLETSLREAFSSSPTVMEGKEGILNQQTAILEGGANSPQINPIMLEFLSQKHESALMDDTKAEIDKMKKEGIKAEMTERGLVLKFDDNALKFAPASANIDEASKKALEKVGAIINSKFKIHIIKVEGHTDSDPPRNTIYPTNWELSSARASSVVNFFIKNNNIDPRLLVATGFAHTSPLAPNDSPSNKAKNRRVEIVILKNKYAKLENKDLQEILKKKFEPTSASSVPSSERVVPQSEKTILEPEDVGSAKIKRTDSDNLYIKETERIKEESAKSNRPLFMEGS